jgi:SnoaL-like domain
MSELTLTAQDREEIKTILAAYVQVVDNADWDRGDEVFTADATFGGGSGAPGAPLSEMIDGFDEMVAARPVPLFPHQCTDAVLVAVAPGVVRSWSKFFTVRADGTVTSGDYMDTIVRSETGEWRIKDRSASMGNRPDSDPFGPSRRTFTSAIWRTHPDELRPE